MHEGSIAASIIEETKKYAQENNISAVKKVFVKAGVMRAVVDDALKFFFDIMKKEENIVKDAELLVEREEILCRCKKCNTEFRPEGLFFICPQCGSTDVEILEGDSILLMSIEGE